MPSLLIVPSKSGEIVRRLGVLFAMLLSGASGCDESSETRTGPVVITAPTSAVAQPVPVVQLTAGQAIPLGQRVSISSDVPYPIEGTSASVVVSGIMELHGPDGSSVRGTMTVIDDAGTTRLVPSAAPDFVWQETAGSLQWTVYALYRLGGVELRVDRAPAPTH